MLNTLIWKQDFLINKKTILLSYVFQFLSLLLAMIIRNMRLIEISDIFWDTLPIVVVPMIMQMILACEIIKKREADQTMTFLLSTEHSPARIITAKALFLLLNLFLLYTFSMFFGCLAQVYDLTGVWTVNTYIVLHLGGMCLQLFIGGWCFLISCLGKPGKTLFYLRAAVGVLVLEYGLYFLYYLYPQPLFFMQFLTLFSLFRQEWYAAASLVALPAAAVLAVLGLLFFLIGRHAFCTRSMRS